MPCSGTTWVGTLTDGGGAIHHVFCDTCRSVRIASTDHGRKTWRITCVREGAFRPLSRPRRHPPGRSLGRTLSELHLFVTVP